jgi:hypothetical protein
LLLLSPLPLPLPLALLLLLVVLLALRLQTALQECVLGHTGVHTGGQASFLGL